MSQIWGWPTRTDQNLSPGAWSYNGLWIENYSGYIYNPSLSMNSSAAGTINGGSPYQTYNLVFNVGVWAEGAPSSGNVYLVVGGSTYPVVTLPSYDPVYGYDIAFAKAGGRMTIYEDYSSIFDINVAVNVTVRSGDVVYLKTDTGIADGSWAAQIMNTTIAPCAACQSGACAIQGVGGDGSQGSVDVNISLGRNSTADRGGVLNLHIDQPLTASVSDGNNTFNQTYSTSSLSPILPVDADIVPGSGNEGFLQIKTSQVFVNRTTLSGTGGTGYQLDFYPLGNVSSTKTGGVYTFSGSPYASWKVLDATTIGGGDPSNGTAISVIKTDLVASKTSEWDYVWNGDYAYGNTTLSGWEMTTKDGSATLSWEGLYKGVLYSPIDGTPAMGEVRIIKDAGGNVVSEVEQGFGPSGIDNSNLLWESVGTPGSARTTTYSEGVEQDWNGHWSSTVLDSYQRPLQQIQQVGNNAYTGSWPDDDNRMIATDYDDTNNLESTTETLQGVVVGKRWRKLEVYGTEYSGENNLRKVTEATATSANATTYDDTSNLLTVTYLYDTTNATVGSQKNAPFLVVNPDGTATKYEYVVDGGGNTTTTTWTGNLSSGPSGFSATIGDGTKTVTVTDKYGALISSESWDISSNLAVSNETVLDNDSFGRPTHFNYFNGTAGEYNEYTDYDCCADVSRIDRYGIETLSNYDAKHNLVLQEQYAGAGNTAPPELRTEYQYDAAGRQTAVLIGPVSSQITQSQTGYDEYGDVAWALDGLSRNTTYTTAVDAEGYTVHTTTNPDGSTVVERYYQDGRLYETTGTGAHGVRYTYGVDPSTNSEYSVTTPLDVNGYPMEDAAVMQYTDFAGRPWKTIAPSPSGSGTVTTQDYYNSKGRLVKVTKTGQPDTLYAYDDLGRQTAAGQDLNADGSLTGSGGADRLTQTSYSVASYTPAGGSATVVNEMTTTQWITSNTSLNITANTAVDGTGSWVTNDGLLTSTTVSADVLNATVTQTVTNPDSTKDVTVTTNGRQTAVTHRDSGGGELWGTTYAYDGYNRMITEADARNGNTTMAYDGIGRVLSVTTPSPGGGGSAQALTYDYVDGDAGTGCVSTVTVERHAGNTSGNVVETGVRETYATGEVALAYGSGGPAAEYTYDYAGRPETLTTWQAFDSGNGTGIGNSATTTWIYNDAGFVTGKRYQNNIGPDYTYNNNGTLATRVWARSALDGTGNVTRLTTNYGYDSAGDLANITYSSNLTANVAYGNYDRLGRVGDVTDGSGSRTLTYAHGVVTSEAYTAGGVANFSITRNLDGVYRVAETAVVNSGYPGLPDVFYNYNGTTGLLGNVTWGNETAVYGYAANSSLVANVTFKHAGAAKLTASRAYDYLDRVTNVTNVPSGSGGNVTYAYVYNDRNQRAKVTRADGSYWSYGYDSDGAALGLGQVVSATAYTSGNAAIAGLDANYTYDDLGNRLTAGRNGVANGSLAYSGNYYSGYYDAADPEVPYLGANELNQYNSRDVPRVLEEFGLANNASTVTMTGTPPGGANVTVGNISTVWSGNYWYNQLSFSGNNANGPQWTSVNITATMAGGHTSAVAGKMYLPAHPEIYAYDADGNLLSDGRWNYVWDAENRLAGVVTSEAAVAAGLGRQAMVFGYDEGNRRIGKAVYDWDAAGNGTWVLTQSEKYLYDGERLLMELNLLGAYAKAVRECAWGPDLSGSMTGAGGVGGLLMASLWEDGNLTPTIATVYYGYDGNGNVQTLVDNTGNVVANYDYDAFGNTVRETGNWAAYNPFRFSTKYDETTGTYAGRDTGLYDYGQRWFSPGLGRFVNRDPMEEQGGVNLYAYCSNDDINYFDSDGEGPTSSNGAPIGARPAPPAGAGAPNGVYYIGRNGSNNRSPLDDVVGFITGIGPREVHYTISDQATRDLASTPTVKNAVTNAIQALQAWCCKKTPIVNPHILNFSEFGAGYSKVLQDIGNVLFGSPSAANLALIGSFVGDYTLTNVNCSDGTSVISFHIENDFGLRSATRNPNNGSKWLHDNAPYKTGPFSTVHEYFDWQQLLNFKSQ